MIKFWERSGLYSGQKKILNFHKCTLQEVGALSVLSPSMFLISVNLKIKSMSTICDDIGDNHINCTNCHIDKDRG